MLVFVVSAAPLAPALCDGKNEKWAVALHRGPPFNFERALIMKNEELLADETISLADEIEADARQGLAKLEELLALARAARDFQAVAHLTAAAMDEEKRIVNAAALRNSGLELKSVRGVNN